MSVIGPRPQLVRDMVFMSDEQRKRHTAKPGLSGLAQVNGRNAISWEDKIAHSSDVVEINTYEQLRELDEDSNHLKSDAIDVIPKSCVLPEIFHCPLIST